MIDKITEIFGNVSNEDYKSFNDKINSIINFTRTTENVSRDFSWVPIVEETIPYLDTIIRNPKKFLQQEEDIVIVEKSKKISTETVRHLAQHTNFILIYFNFTNYITIFISLNSIVINATKFIFNTFSWF